MAQTNYTDTEVFLIVREYLRQTREKAESDEQSDTPTEIRLTTSDRDNGIMHVYEGP